MWYKRGIIERIFLRLTIFLLLCTPKQFDLENMSEGINPKPLSRRLLPYIVAFMAFFAIPAIYFAPQFSGNILIQPDMIQYNSKSQEVVQHREQYGEDPQWLGNSFSGMPANLTNMLHNTQLISKLRPVLDIFGTPTSYIFCAMAAFFVMLLMIGVNPWAAIPPAIAYGLSTYFFIIIDVGHITKMLALAYAPLMLGAVFYAYRRNMWLGAALTALFLALQISVNHVQITYYFAMVLVAFWINELVAALKNKTMPRFLKTTGLMIVAVIFAVGANFSSLYGTYQYSKDSIRGKSELITENEMENNDSGLDIEYATAWSYGKAESFNMYIPNLMGGSSTNRFEEGGAVAQEMSWLGIEEQFPYLGTYWGDQPGTSGPTYIGAVIIFLCVLGLFLLKGRCKWWVVAITLIALMLAWGNNFMWFTELFFNFMPGYNKFRTVAMILVIAEWSVPFIAALLLAKLWNDEIDKQRLLKALKYSLFITGGFALLFLLFGGMLFDFMAPHETEYPRSVLNAMIGERMAMMRSDAFRSLIFVLLTAATVWIFALGKLKKYWMVVILAILVCADLIPVNLRYLPQSKFVPARFANIQPTSADLKILKDTTPGFRVLNLTVSPFNDGTTSYFHRSVGGYDGAKMTRYQDVIDRYLSKSNMEIYNMLNTRYFIVPERGAGEPIAQFNPDANGAAWFVGTVVIAASANQEIEALDTLATKTEAVVDKRFESMLPPGNDTLRISDNSQFRYYQVDPLARIRLVDYKSNHLTYEYDSESAGVAVFSEIYYDKGWKAFVDGVETPHFRTDYILRGMSLPAGKHKVEFVYRAAGFDMASNVALVFSLLIIAGVVAAAVVTILCNRKKKMNNVRE